MKKLSTINENIENKVLYHGSSLEFDEFDDKKISDDDLFGKGFYLTDSKEIATFYAKHITKKNRITGYDNTGIFGTPEPIYSDDADDYSNKNFKLNKFRIRGNILNSETYVISKDLMESLRDCYVKEFGEGFSTSFDKLIDFMHNNKHRIRNYRGELIYVIQQASNKKITNTIVDYIKKMGYDGVKYRPDLDFEGNDNKWNYAIYNKNIISKENGKN